LAVIVVVIVEDFIIIDVVIVFVEFIIVKFVVIFVAVIVVFGRVIFALIEVVLILILVLVRTLFEVGLEQGLPGVVSLFDELDILHKGDGGSATGEQNAEHFQLFARLALVGFGLNNDGREFFFLVVPDHGCGHAHIDGMAMVGVTEGKDGISGFDILGPSATTGEGLSLLPS
jgi:hypothetical protein